MGGGFLFALSFPLIFPLSYLLDKTGLIESFTANEFLSVFILLLLPALIFSFFLSLLVLIRLWKLFSYKFEEDGIRITTGFIKRGEYFIPFADIKRTYMYNDFITDMLGLRIIFLDAPNYFYNLNGIFSSFFLSSWWYRGGVLIGLVFHRKWWSLPVTACVWYSEKKKADELLNFLNSKLKN